MKEFKSLRVQGLKSSRREGNRQQATGKSKTLVFASRLAPHLFFLFLTLYPFNPSTLGLSFAFAQEPYKGKTVRLIINFTAGGPTDIFGRIVARYLPKYIPGQPTLVVQNMGGAGGIIGANYVYEVAKPDGLTVGLFSGMYMQQILRASGLRYDLTKMPIIAGAAETSVQFVRSDTGVKSASDLLKSLKAIRVGGFGKENTKDLGLRLALEILGVPHSYVPGYPGAAEIRLAIVRGEVNYGSESLAGYNAAVVPLVREGIMVPVFQEGLLGPDGDSMADPRTDVPDFKAAFTKAKGKAPSGPLWEAFKIILGTRSMLRFIAVTPGTPPRLVEILRGAFRQTFEDPEFKAESERTMRFQPKTFIGEEAEKVNVSVFRAATGPALEVLTKMSGD